MNFFNTIADFQIARAPSRSFFPLPFATSPRKPRESSAGRIARAAVREVLG